MSQKEISLKRGNFDPLLGTPFDKKSIGLVKLLFSLRQNLDLYCLISVNAEKINRVSGSGFWGHLQRLAVHMISLDLCKIYEKETNYQLNSIDAIVQKLLEGNGSQLDCSKLKSFIETYKGPFEEGQLISNLQTTIEGFRKNFQVELERLKTARDKIIAHSEYDVEVPSLPSYDTLEKLFLFGVDFYELVLSALGDVSSVPIKDERRVKNSLLQIFCLLGIKDLKEDMK